jgi:polyisoprenoid-binding protein YceI
MQNKLILGGVVLLLVIAGGYWYLTQTGNEVEKGSNAEFGSMKDDSDTSVNNDMVLEEDSEEGDVYVVDQAQSSLVWSAERIVGNAHTGTVPVTGSVAVNEDTFVAGEFVIDLTQITESENNERFLTHLSSEDFFEVESYPTATLSVIEVNKVSGDNNFTVTANLTIKDITEEITFPATIVKDGENIRATADFTIDRTRWDIVYDSGTIFSEIGDRAIRDEIEFNLALIVSPK